MQANQRYLSISDPFEAISCTAKKILSFVVPFVGVSPFLLFNNAHLYRNWPP